MIKIAGKEDLPRLCKEFSSWIGVRGEQYEPIDIASEMSRTYLNGTIIYAENDDGKVIGLLGALPIIPLWTGKKTAIEHVWFVLPEYRNSGVGMKMLEVMEEWAKKYGCSSVMLSPSRYGSDDPGRVRDILTQHGYDLFAYQLNKEL